MKSWIISSLVTLVLLYLIGWLQLPIQPRLEQHEKFVGAGKIGFSHDYWLVKGASLASSQDRVALFMGYADDLEGCRDVGELLNRKYPEARYQCNLAN